MGTAESGLAAEVAVALFIIAYNLIDAPNFDGAKHFKLYPDVRIPAPSDHTRDNTGFSDFG
jgi:hypothetical protein